jgi:hypothetical protein
MLFSCLSYRYLLVPTHVVWPSVAAAPNHLQSPCVQVLIAEGLLCDEVRTAGPLQAQVTPKWGLDVGSGNEAELGRPVGQQVRVILE